MSLPVRPVPPVVMITSILSFLVQSKIIFFISSLSSFTNYLSDNLCFCSAIFFTKIEPDLSFSIVLVSVIVNKAMLICIFVKMIDDK